MNHLSRPFKVILIAVAAWFALAVSACGSGPIPTKYLLPSPEISVKKSLDTRPLLITRVQLPGYARGAAVCTREHDHTISESRMAEWASSPQESVIAVLARHIEGVGDYTVAQRPVAASFNADARIAVLFDEFVRLPDNSALLEGQVRIDAADAHRVVRFSLRSPATGSAIDSYMLAKSNALADLARLIDVQLSESGE
ncbi:MAG: ABC-type transport auxiliary lipoprotein family protein [Pseudomonadota bacterium]